MDNRRIFFGVLLFLTIGAGMAYILGTGFLALWRTGSAEVLDFTALLREYPAIRAYDPRAFQIINMIFIVTMAGMGLAAVNLINESLTTFGTTHWQSRRELKANEFFGAPGAGFVLAKNGTPRSAAPFITSKNFPHCLLVAPTGAGKGVGFVIPNLLLFKGSAVVLDVKGENYEKTARHRQSMGDKVWRFAPLDFKNPGHRYNPLQRIFMMDDPDERQLELRAVANLFLQSDSQEARGLLDGGIDLFVACGIYAMERGTPTLGEIYRLSASGGDKQRQYMSYAEKVRSPAARLIFERLASTNDRTLTSYLSLLMTSGLSAWDNPAIDRATATSDFSFRDFRREPNTVYFISPPHEKIRSIAPLARLFFGDLLSSLHAYEPPADEPWRVMVMLDEFDMLGKMPAVTDSIKTLRSYGGHLAIVTQTIPALDEIYGENTRLSLQGNAGVKLYLSPSEKETVAELSSAVGMTTKRVVSRSRTVGKGAFSGVNVSERTEEKSLLTEDQARRLNTDDVILIVNGQHPIQAKRIKYYDDRVLKRIFEAQSGPYPSLSKDTRAVEDLRTEVEVLRAEISAVRQTPRRSVRKLLTPAALEQVAASFETAFQKKTEPATAPEQPDQAAQPATPVEPAAMPQPGGAAPASTGEAGTHHPQAERPALRRRRGGGGDFARQAELIDKGAANFAKLTEATAGLDSIIHDTDHIAA